MLLRLCDDSQWQWGGNQSSTKLQLKADRAVKYANHPLESEQAKQGKHFVESIASKLSLSLSLSLPTHRSLRCWCTQPSLTSFTCTVLMGNLALPRRRARVCRRACMWKQFVFLVFLCMQQGDSELGLKRALLVAPRGCRFIFVLRGWPPDEPTAALPFSILAWQRAAHGALSNCLPYLKYWQRGRKGGASVP